MNLKICENQASKLNLNLKKSLHEISSVFVQFSYTWKCHVIENNDFEVIFWQKPGRLSLSPWKKLATSNDGIVLLICSLPN